MSVRRYRITVGGKAFEVEVGDLDRSPVRVVVDGSEYRIDLPGRGAAPSPPPTSATPVSPAPAPAPSPQAPTAPAPAAGANAVTAMMPGRVVSIEVKPGDEVKRGQTVCVIESMKMEQNIASPKDGRVASVPVSAGDSVQRGQTLVELE